MNDIAIVKHLSDGLTVKEVAAICKEKSRAIEHRIVLMKGKYFASTQSHLVAIFIRKKLIE